MNNRIDSNVYYYGSYSPTTNKQFYIVWGFGEVKAAATTFTFSKPFSSPPFLVAQTVNKTDVVTITNINASSVTLDLADNRTAYIYYIVVGY